jgi:hypothetical protein
MTNEKVQEIEAERFIKISFRKLPNDLVRTQYDVETVSEEEIMLALSELASVLSTEYLGTLMQRIDQLVAERIKELPASSSVN